jgi:probable HAF family extracellular repeat protein
MKPRFRMLLSAVMFFAGLALLFAGLALPLRLAAQDKQDNNRRHARYAITVLDTLGGRRSIGNGLNNRGHVAGFATTPGDTAGRAVLWSQRVITDLGTLGGPNSFTASGHIVNERGVVAGFSDSSTPDPLGEDFCAPFTGGDGTGLTCIPFVWRNGVITGLPTLGGNNGAALGINSRGQVVGTAENATINPACGPPQKLDFEAVIWEPRKGEIQELPPFAGDTDGLAQGINDNGQAVGFSGNCSSFAEFFHHALLWQNGTATDLGNLGGANFNLATDINNQGQVVGQSDLAGDITGHAFLWTEEDGMQDLGTLSGDVLSEGLGINNQGQVVGISFDASGNVRAFIWQNGVMTDLNTLIPAGSSLFLLEALGINDRGQIAGFGALSNGDFRAYLLTPCDEQNGERGCEEGANAVPQTNPAGRDVPIETLPPSLACRMSRYHFPGRAFGPKD